MSDTYKGESPGKKLARMQFWGSVALALGDRFYRKKHLVLASQHGGDISVLVGLGVDPRNVIAVDLRPDAVAACKARWPTATVKCRDVRMAAQDHRKELASVFLDFTWAIGPDVADVTRRRRAARLGAEIGESDRVTTRYGASARAAVRGARDPRCETGGRTRRRSASCT